jgi:hypothetical protein
MLSIAFPTATATTTIMNEQEELAQTSDNSLKIYENPTYGIKIQYPSNWRVN